MAEHPHLTVVTEHALCPGAFPVYVCGRPLHPSEIALGICEECFAEECRRARPPIEAPE